MFVLLLFFLLWLFLGGHTSSQGRFRIMSRALYEESKMVKNVLHCYVLTSHDNRT